MPITRGQGLNSGNRSMNSFLARELMHGGWMLLNPIFIPTYPLKTGRIS
jgi:hypothetical protein